MHFKYFKKQDKKHGEKAMLLFCIEKHYNNQLININL